MINGDTPRRNIYGGALHILYYEVSLKYTRGFDVLCAMYVIRMALLAVRLAAAVAIPAAVIRAVVAIACGTYSAVTVAVATPAVVATVGAISGIRAFKASAVIVTVISA